jgi:hypothetical protein
MGICFFFLYSQDYRNAIEGILLELEGAVGHRE